MTDLDYIKNEKPIDRLNTGLAALLGIRAAFIAAAEGNGFAKQDCDYLAYTAAVVLIFTNDAAREIEESVVPPG